MFFLEADKKSAQFILTFNHRIYFFRHNNELFVACSKQPNYRLAYFIKDIFSNSVGLIKPVVLEESRHPQKNLLSANTNNFFQGETLELHWPRKVSDFLHRCQKELPHEQTMLLIKTLPEWKTELSQTPTTSNHLGLVNQLKTIIENFKTSPDQDEAFLSLENLTDIDLSEFNAAKYVTRPIG